jgi:acetoin utilization deacetylase AcuC-like enzyme
LLGQLKYSNDGYKKATDILLSLAKKYSENRMMYVLEGGYEPKNITEASERILSTIISKNNNSSQP